MKSSYIIGNLKTWIVVIVSFLASGIISYYVINSSHNNMMFEIILFHLIPGFTFGLALASKDLVLGHTNTIVSLCIKMVLAWIISYYFCVYIVGRILGFNNIFFFLISGLISGFITIRFADFATSIKARIFTYIFSLLGSMIAFVVFYLLVSGREFWINNQGYLFLIWHPLVGFLLALGREE